MFWMIVSLLLYGCLIVFNFQYNATTFDFRNVGILLWDCSGLRILFFVPKACFPDPAWSLTLPARFVAWFIKFSCWFCLSKLIDYGFMYFTKFPRISLSIDDTFEWYNEPTRSGWWPSLVVTHHECGLSGNLFSLSPAAPFQDSQDTLASKDISTSVSLQNLCIYFAYCHRSVPCPGFPGFRPTFIPT